MANRPKTVKEYLDSLTPERRTAIQALRKVIRANLDPKVKEGIQYGMIGYFVPHSVYPAGYHCDPKEPLPFLSLASQKNHMAVYLFCLYTDSKAAKQFADDWKQSGNRLDMGKSCVRFKSLDAVPLDVIASTVKRMSVAEFLASYEASRPAAGGSKKVTKRKASKRAASKKATKRKASKKAASKKASKRKASKKAASKKASKRKASKKAASKKTSKRKASKKAASKKTVISRRTRKVAAKKRTTQVRGSSKR